MGFEKFIRVNFNCTDNCTSAANLKQKEVDYNELEIKLKKKVNDTLFNSALDNPGSILMLLEKTKLLVSAIKRDTNNALIQKELCKNKRDLSSYSKDY